MYLIQHPDWMGPNEIIKACKDGKRRYGKGRLMRERETCGKDTEFPKRTRRFAYCKRIEFFFGRLKVCVIWQYKHCLAISVNHIHWTLYCIHKSLSRFYLWEKSFIPQSCAWLFHNQKTKLLRYYSFCKLLHLPYQFQNLKVNRKFIKITWLIKT